MFQVEIKSIYIAVATKTGSSTRKNFTGEYKSNTRAETRSRKLTLCGLNGVWLTIRFE